VYVAREFDALYSEIDEEAATAAEAVNRACRAVEAAFAERMDVERRLSSLVGMVRPARPGDIARTRAEAVVREANALLEAGGEAAPMLQG